MIVIDESSLYYIDYSYLFVLFNIVYFTPGGDLLRLLGLPLALTWLPIDSCSLRVIVVLSRKRLCLMATNDPYHSVIVDKLDWRLLEDSVHWIHQRQATGLGNIRNKIAHQNDLHGNELITDEQYREKMDQLR